MSHFDLRAASSNFSRWARVILRRSTDGGFFQLKFFAKRSATTSFMVVRFSKQNTRSFSWKSAGNSNVSFLKPCCIAEKFNAFSILVNNTLDCMVSQSYNRTIMQIAPSFSPQQSVYSEPAVSPAYSEFPVQKEWSEK